MAMIDIARQLFLYAHILAFALAMAEVLREDWRMLWATRIDSAGLAATAERVKWFLVVLWATGLPLVGLDLGWNFALIVDRPKLMMKLLVVVVLTINGVLLHFVAFPLLTRKTDNLRIAAAIPAVLGAVSTVSWLYASFVGVARLIAPQMTFLMFFGLYALMLIGAIGVAVLFMRGRLELMIKAGHQEPAMPVGKSAVTGNDNADFPVFLEVEVALAAVGHAHNRLIALRNNFHLERADLYDALLEEDSKTAASPSDRSRSIRLLKTAAA